MPISPHPHIFCCVCPACISKRIHTHPHIIQLLIFSHFGIVWKSTTVVTLPKTAVYALLASASVFTHTRIYFAVYALPAQQVYSQTHAYSSILTSRNYRIIPHIQDDVKQKKRPNKLGLLIAIIDISPNTVSRC